MRLHSAVFSRDFRRLLRAERRANPALRRAMRRKRPVRAWKQPLLLCLFRPLWGLIPAALAAAAHGVRWPAATGAAIAAWWFLEVIVIGQSIVRNLAHNPPPPLLFLPFGRENFVRLARRQVLGLLWRPFVDALALLGVLAGWLAVAPLAALGALATWSAAVWLTRWRMPGLVTTAALVLPVALAFGLRSEWFLDRFHHALVTQAGWLTLISPGGWVAASATCWRNGSAGAPRP